MMIVCESKYIRFQLVVGKTDVVDVGEAISNLAGDFDPAPDPECDVLPLTDKAISFGFGV